MTKLKLYFDTLSQPCRAVKLFLLVNKIEYEPKLVKLSKGEHLSQEFGEINPFHKIPVIQHNNFTLTESVAILRYLCREYNVADHWYSKDSVKQARVDEYLEWQHLNTRLYCAMYFRIKFIIPLMSGNPPKQSLLDMYFKGMEDTCDIIENIWLKGKNFLCGDEISVADLIGICELEQPRMAGYDPRKGRPLIEDWMTRVKNHLNPHYDIVNIRLEKIISNYKDIPPMMSKI